MKKLFEEDDGSLFDSKETFCDIEIFINNNKKIINEYCNPLQTEDTEKNFDNLLLKHESMLIDIDKKLDNAKMIYYDNKKLKDIDEKLENYVKKSITIAEKLLETKENLSFFYKSDLRNKATNTDLENRISRAKTSKIIHKKDFNDSKKEIQELKKDIEDIKKNILQQERDSLRKIL